MCIPFFRSRDQRLAYEVSLTFLFVPLYFSSPEPPASFEATPDFRSGNLDRPLKGLVGVLVMIFATRGGSEADPDRRHGWDLDTLDVLST